jgi:hypothetical protein
VAKLAYATDSKWKLCSFCPLLNSAQPSDPAKENDLDALKAFAGLLGNFLRPFEGFITQIITQIFASNETPWSRHEEVKQRCI